ncbi:MAG: hypothetical protein R2795_19310 [Saprospiraceae bacterium]
MQIYTRIICLLMVGWMTSSVLYAQQSSIAGQIITDEGQAAEFVNVLLMQAAGFRLGKNGIDHDQWQFYFPKYSGWRLLAKSHGIGF